MSTCASVIFDLFSNDGRACTQALSPVPNIQTMDRVVFAIYLSDMSSKCAPVIDECWWVLVHCGHIDL